MDREAIQVDDCLPWLQQQPDDSFDLVVTSPPYEDARTYGVGFNVKGQDWVDWCLDRFVECYRVSKGLVVWVVEGRTRNFQWSAVPMLLAADLHRRGIKLRKPPIYNRVGIPGSGGLDWWRNDYEFCICATKGKLPWSENTASGQPCKYAPGGDVSNRKQNGERVTSQTRRKPNGERARDGLYHAPAIANPGNVIKCHGGGGHLGDDLAHENEAPFPENLVEPFIKCFCPPNGIVLDPFMGSGTTLAVAKKLGRRAVGLDIRASQVELTNRRLAKLDPAALAS